MPTRRLLSWSLAALLVLGLAGVWSCSKSSSPTSPGGGGGGGGGLELNSGDFGPGASFQHQFMTAGVFPYHCIHHAPMTGSVTVSASATATQVNVSITSSMAPFPGATVKPGGVVTWTNNTTAIHTVTSN